MTVMTEPRKPAKKTPVAKKSSRPGKTSIYAYLDERLVAAMEAYIAEARPATDKTGVVSWALEKLLSELGFWPPDGGADAD